MKKIKNFSPYMNSLQKKHKNTVIQEIKTNTTVKKLQSTKVEIYNFHKPISKIIDFYDF
jgi:hypothetical protein